MAAKRAARSREDTVLVLFSLMLQPLLNDAPVCIHPGQEKWHKGKQCYSVKGIFFSR